MVSVAGFQAVMETTSPSAISALRCSPGEGEEEPLSREEAGEPDYCKYRVPERRQDGSCYRDK